MSQYGREPGQIRRVDARRNRAVVIEEARRLALLGERVTIPRVATGVGLGAATVKRHLGDRRQMEQAVADRSAALLWTEIVRAERIQDPLDRLGTILRILANAQADARCVPTGEQVEVATRWRARVIAVAEKAFLQASGAGLLRPDARPIELTTHYEIVQALVAGGGSRMLAQQAVTQLLRALKR